MKTGQLRPREVSVAVIGVVLGVLLAGGLIPWIIDDGTDEVAVRSVPGEAADSLDMPSGADEPGAASVDGNTAAENGAPSGATAGSGPRAGTAQAGGRSAGGAVGGGGAGATPGTAATVVGGATRTASDVGVTPNEIRAGVLLLDLAVVGQVGFGQGTDGLDPKEQRRWYQAFFDDINKSGGIHGRTLKPVYAIYDPTNFDTQRRACLAHTEDNDVFAAMENTGGYRGPVILCYTQEHETPFLSAPHRHNLDIIRKSGNRLMAYGMTVHRALANSVYELEAMGELKGKTIGVIENVRPGDQETTTVGLVNTLAKVGYKVAERYAFSDDLSVASSQVPLAVQVMRSAGVNLIYVNSNVLTSTQFVQAADGQVYHPKYVTVDHYGVGSDFGAMNMPQSFAGSLGFTAERDAEHNDPRRPSRAVDKRCDEILERATGEKFAPDSNSAALVRLSCGVVALLANGLRNSGPNPTRAKFAEAVQRLGRVDPPRMGPGVFAPGRLDAASQIRTQTWDAGCRCWMIAKDFHDARV